MSGRVDIAELARLREEQGLGYRQIADELGLSAGYVSYLCLEHDIRHPRKAFLPGQRPAGAVYQRGGRPLRTFTPAEDALIVERRKAGASLPAIGREIGRCQSSIRGRLLTLARHDEMGEPA